MTIEKARLILKDKGKNLSDKQIRLLLDQALAFADLTIDFAFSIYKKGGRNALAKWPKTCQ